MNLIEIRKNPEILKSEKAGAPKTFTNYYRELDTAIATAGGITDHAQSRKRASNAEFRESERVHADTRKADTDAGRRETDILSDRQRLREEVRNINRRNSVSDNRIVRNAEAESIAFSRATHDLRNRKSV